MVEPPATVGRACISIGPAYLPLLDDSPERQPPVVLVEGNRGSAKTRSILTILILRALRWPKSRWALWRSSRSRLTETVLETLETQVLPLFAMSVPHVQNRTRYTCLTDPCSSPSASTISTAAPRRSSPVAT